MDPNGAEIQSIGHASIPFDWDTVPPIGGEVAAPPNADAPQDSASLFKITSNDGHSSTRASSHPLLSQVARLVNASQGGSSSFCQTFPRDFLVMLCISPQLAGGFVGYILLKPSKRIHQDAFLAYFDSAGRVVHVLPCPNFDNFLQSNFLCPCDISFLSNLPNLAYLLSMGPCILRDNDYSQDAPLNLTWLPTVPSNPLVLSNLTIFQEIPWREVHPYVNAHTPPKPGGQGPHRCPNPDDVNSKFIASYHPPVPYAMGGHSGFGSFSPLTTSFNMSMYGGSHKTIQSMGGIVTAIIILQE